MSTTDPATPPISSTAPRTFACLWPLWLTRGVLTLLDSVPLCGRHRFHWGGRVLAMVLPFFALLGLVVLLVAVSSGPDKVANERIATVIGFTLLAGFVGWLILLAVISSTTMRPTEITEDRSITLTGVSREFEEAA